MAVVNGWFADWMTRRDRMVRDGLPVYFDRVTVHGDFVAFWVHIQEAHVPRPHIDRGFSLHLSIGFLSTWRERGLDMEGVQRYIDELNRRYCGQHRLVKVQRLGCGGAAIFHEDDDIMKDPIFNVLYEFGGYEWKEPHISL
jgi:hypothetical protein